MFCSVYSSLGAADGWKQFILELSIMGYKEVNDPMEPLEKLMMMAEDELTEYSTTARKIERLRPKLSLAVPYPQQQQLRQRLAAEMPNHILARLVENQRQLCALPFWGIGGLGLLIGISAQQPLDLVATGVGFYLAFAIQKWGWSLEARRLLIKTLDEIETSMAADRMAS